MAISVFHSHCSRLYIPSPSICAAVHLSLGPCPMIAFSTLLSRSSNPGWGRRPQDNVTPSREGDRRGDWEAELSGIQRKGQRSPGWMLGRREHSPSQGLREKTQHSNAVGRGACLEYVARVVDLRSHSWISPIPVGWIKNLFSFS